MPLENFGDKHLSAAQMQTIDAALAALENVINTVSINLTDEERQRFGSINEQNKLIANKIYDYHKTQPSLDSPDVDWVEYEADYLSRQFADTRLNRLAGIVRVLSDFKIAHDFDNYQAALRDYSYCKYKADTNAIGYAEKMRDIKQFFPNNG